ncbi:hypothetical protein Tco_1279225, partial [Tanacetum coccineum]
VARDEAVTIHFIYIAINFPITVQSWVDILKIHSRKMNLMRGIDLKKIVEKMNGASGAELKPQHLVSCGDWNPCLLRRNTCREEKWNVLCVADHIAEFKPSCQTFVDGNIIQVTLRDDMAKSFYKDAVMSLGPPIIATVTSIKVAHYGDRKGDMIILSFRLEPLA